MPIAFLLALQAAGMITDWIGTSRQQELADMGAKLQRAGIETNMEQIRLESEDASLQAMKNLRRTLGSQIATFAARGTRTGAGSALSIMNESVSNFNADERTRKMNLMGNLASLKAKSSISALNQMTSNSKLWNSFYQRSLNRIPTSGQGFGLTSIGS